MGSLAGVASGDRRPLSRRPLQATLRHSWSFFHTPKTDQVVEMVQVAVTAIRIQLGLYRKTSKTIRRWSWMRSPSKGRPGLLEAEDVGGSVLGREIEVPVFQREAVEGAEGRTQRSPLPLVSREADDLDETMPLNASASSVIAAATASWTAGEPPRR